MNIQQTIISETGEQATVKIVIADHADPENVKEFVNIQVVIPSDPNPHFAAIQKVALLRARELIDKQIQERSAALRK